MIYEATFRQREHAFGVRKRIVAYYRHFDPNKMTSVKLKDKSLIINDEALSHLERITTELNCRYKIERIE